MDMVGYQELWHVDGMLVGNSMVTALSCRLHFSIGDIYIFNIGDIHMIYIFY